MVKESLLPCHVFGSSGVSHRAFELSDPPGKPYTLLGQKHKKMHMVGHEHIPPHRNRMFGLCALTKR